jgi:hypothetical protein
MAEERKRAASVRALRGGNHVFWSFRLQALLGTGLSPCCNLQRAATATAVMTSPTQMTTQVLRAES